MKKFYLILCLLLAIFPMIGCSVEINDQNEQTQMVEPALQLIFNSASEYVELIAAADLPDNELGEYLTNNSFDMNGIKTRSDIQALEATVSALPIPAVDELQITNIVIYPEWNQMYIRFVSADGAVIGTSIQMDPNSAAERIKKKTGVFGTSRKTVETDNMDLVVCVDYSNEDVCAYQADVDGYFLTFRFHDCTSVAAEKILKEMKFVNISEWE